MTVRLMLAVFSFTASQALAGTCETVKGYAAQMRAAREEATQAIGHTPSLPEDQVMRMVELSRRELARPDLASDPLQVALYINYLGCTDSCYGVRSLDELRAMLATAATAAAGLSEGALRKDPELAQRVADLLDGGLLGNDPQFRSVVEDRYVAEQLRRGGPVPTKPYPSSDLVKVAAEMVSAHVSGYLDQFFAEPSSVTREAREPIALEVFNLGLALKVDDLMTRREALVRYFTLDKVFVPYLEALVPRVCSAPR